VNHTQSTMSHLYTYHQIVIVFCHETMRTNYNCISWLHTQITMSILYTFQLPLSFVMRSCVQTIIPSIGSTPKLPSQSCITSNCHCLFVIRPCPQTTIPWIGSYKCPIHDECVSSWWVTNLISTQITSNVLLSFQWIINVVLGQIKSSSQWQ
jgi:hypothetical protein